MKDSFLLRISIIISILGLVALFVIAKNIEINDTTIEKINHEQIQGQVKVSGIIKQIDTSEKYTSLIISQDSELKAVAFSKLDLSVGDYVEIIGTLDENTLIIEEIKTKYI